MARSRTATIPRQWIAKTLVGFVFGLALAFGLSGVFLEVATELPPSTESQLAMWMVPPVFLPTFSSVYFFRTAGRALVAFTLANLVVYFALVAIRFS